MAAHPELARRIESHAADIARLACEALRADPVARASLVPLHLMFAPERVAHDVKALIGTLRDADSAGMVTYVRQLQAVVPNGGLTTRHLAAGFGRVHDAILSIGLSDPGAARTMLDRAVLALRYDGTTAAAVQDASRQLAEDAVVALRGVHLGAEEIERQWIEALELLVSYLADSMALQRSELLTMYAGRLATAPPSLVRPAEPSAMLAALRGALDELPDAARHQASAVLAAAEASLTARPG